MTYEEKKEKQLKFTNIAYYLIIGVVSIICTGFIPMLSSKIGLQWNIPDTPAGWVVWTLSKLCIAAVNMVMFYCFMQQAKVNVQDNEKYKEAKEILHRAYKVKNIVPQSPSEWSKKQYFSKGSTLLLSTLLSTVGLSQAILTFNVVEFLSQVFTIGIGITFGYLQMRKAEDYWTSEYYEYALMIKDKMNPQTGSNNDKIEKVDEIDKETKKDA